MPTDGPGRGRATEEENTMSWLEKLLPSKIQQTDPTERRQVPEGLWIKCPSCETVLYKADLEQNQNVCPHCSHHHRIGARARLNAFLDPKAATKSARKCCPWMPSSSRTAASTPSA
jgi:acetyl-CoA carboxylase carboxyl transferase subunit beta